MTSCWFNLFNWQKAFDRVKWTKLVQTVKGTGIDYRERRLIKELYMDQNIKINWTKGRHEVWRLEEELDDIVVCRQYIQLAQRIFYQERSWRFRELQWSGTDTSLGEMCRWLCYWLRKRRCYSTWLLEIVRWYGMEINVDKTRLLQIPKQQSPTQIMIDQTQLENVEYLKCFGKMITIYVRHTRGIKSGITMTKAAFNQ